MKRGDAERLDDVLAASEAITVHLARGGLSDGLVYDAVRLRLIEIGEALKDVDDTLLRLEPEIPWSAARKMRDWLAHHYFDTDSAIVDVTVHEDLPPLLDAVRRLRITLPSD